MKKNLKQLEMMPLPHGGKREGAGRKPLPPELKKAKTVVIRIDERLVHVVKKLKQEIQNNNKELIEQVQNLLSGAK